MKLLSPHLSASTCAYRAYTLLSLPSVVSHLKRVSKAFVGNLVVPKFGLLPNLFSNLLYMSYCSRSGPLKIIPRQLLAQFLYFVVGSPIVISSYRLAGL